MDLPWKVKNMLSNSAPVQQMLRAAGIADIAHPSSHQPCFINGVFLICSWEN